MVFFSKQKDNNLFLDVFSIKEVIVMFALMMFSLFLFFSGVDAKIHLWAMETFPQGFWQELFGYLSRMGQDWFQIIVAVLAAFYFYSKCNYKMVKVFYGAIPIFLISGIIVYILKVIIGRPRPKMLETMYEPEWFEFAARMHSYPSGHALTTFCFLAVVERYFSFKVRVVLWSAAIFISLARVGIGAHFLADVVAGATIGYALGRYMNEKTNFTKYKEIK